MASPQYFEASQDTFYYPVEPGMEFLDVEGWYESTPEGEEHLLYDNGVGACSPTNTAVMRQDLMCTEHELLSNFLSLEVAQASETPVLAGAIPGLATGTPYPFQDDLAIDQLFGSLNFDYLKQPVYQLSSDQGHTQDAANVNEHLALAFESYSDTQGFVPPPPTCVAPEDLHKPTFEYNEPPTTVESAVGPTRRVQRRGASSTPPPITRGPTARNKPIVPGFISLKRRNVQVKSGSASASAANKRRATPSTAGGSTNKWKCPHCQFEQVNRRKPDLKRHIDTHLAKKFWLCCGVPLIDAAEHGVPDEVVRDGPALEYEGLFLVGGCRHTFSRKDAYIRHLNKQAGRCFGDADGVYQPGNGEGAI